MGFYGEIRLGRADDQTKANVWTAANFAANDDLGGPDAPSHILVRVFRPQRPKIERIVFDPDRRAAASPNRQVKILQTLRGLGKRTPGSLLRPFQRLFSRSLGRGRVILPLKLRRNSEDFDIAHRAGHPFGY